MVVVIIVPPTPHHLTETVSIEFLVRDEFLFAAVISRFDLKSLAASSYFKSFILNQH